MNDRSILAVLAALVITAALLMGVSRLLWRYRTRLPWRILRFAWPALTLALYLPAFFDVQLFGEAGLTHWLGFVLLIQKIPGLILGFLLMCAVRAAFGGWSVWAWLAGVVVWDYWFVCLLEAWARHGEVVRLKLEGAAGVTGPAAE